MKFWGIFLALVISTVGVSGQEHAKELSPVSSIGIKTNLLYDATSTLNLGLEFRMSNRTSLDVSGNWNPFTYSDNRKWKHLLIQPEFRFWTAEAFSGHFFGAHAHYAYYNVGRLPSSLFSDYMAEHRFEGWLMGAGVSYGYRWNFTRNWGMEATIGVGYAYMDYDRYTCNKCGEKLGSETKNYFGPTKAGITLIYTLGGKKKPVQPPFVIVDIPQPMPEPVVIEEPRPEVIVPAKSEMEQLTEEHPFVLEASEFNPDEPVQPFNDDRDRTLTIYYELNESILKEAFRDNEITLSALREAIGRVNKSEESKIKHVVIAGFASPEGSAQRNKQLAQERAEAVRDYVLANTQTDKEAIVLHNGAADWEGLRRLVAEDADVPLQKQVLEIIDTAPIWSTRMQKGRQTLLRELGRGRAWEYMRSNLFPQLRNGTFIRVYWEDTNTNRP